MLTCIYLVAKETYICQCDLAMLKIGFGTTYSGLLRNKPKAFHGSLV
jgi:hypothetical protein